MEVHHSKHHQAYITNFNASEVQLQEALAQNNTSKIISLQNALRFNGGGHLNHSIFWNNLTPSKTELSAELKSAIDTSFGNLESFKKEFTAITVAVQGSGWGWLGYNKKTGNVQLAACANQDPLEATTGAKIILPFWSQLSFNRFPPTILVRRFDSIARHRCVGARILLAVQKFAIELCRSDFRRCQLVGCFATLVRSQKVIRSECSDDHTVRPNAIRQRIVQLQSI